MKIAAVCVTWNRPELLGRLVGCFEAQDYPDRELLILDDAGQYGDRRGDRWRLISIPHRWKTLGQKRNAAIGLTSSDVDAYAVWDDDDCYFPFALSACVRALGHVACPWMQSRVICEQENGRLRQYRTADRRGCWPAYHSGWAYRRDVFEVLKGYPHDESNGEDWLFQKEMKAAHGDSADCICPEYPRPFLVYSRRTSGTRHLSMIGRKHSGYEKFGSEPIEPWPGPLPIRYPSDVLDLPVEPEVRPRPW